MAQVRQYKIVAWLMIDKLYIVIFEEKLTHWGRVMPYGDSDLVNIGSGNGLLPDGTKPLPEQMLTYHQ